MFKLKILSASLVAIASAGMLSGTPQVQAQVPELIEAVRAEAQPREELSLDELYQQGIEEMSVWRFVEATATFEALLARDTDGEYQVRAHERLGEIARYRGEELAKQEAESRKLREKRLKEEWQVRHASSIARSAALGSFVGLGLGGPVGFSVGKLRYERMLENQGPWEPLQGLSNAISAPIYMFGGTFLGATLGGVTGTLLGGRLAYRKAIRLDPKVSSTSISVSPVLNRRGDRAFYGLGLKGSF